MVNKKNKNNNKKTGVTTKKSNVTNKESALNYEILGLFFIVFGIVSFISLYSNKMGIVGSLLYKFYSLAMGSGNFLFALILIFWGLIFNSKKYRDSSRRYIIGSLFILISILVILDGSKSFDLTLIDRIKLSMEYADVARSGGIIGAIIGFFMYKLFGSIGAYTILGIVILLSFYFIFKPNVKDLSAILLKTGDKINTAKTSFVENREEKKKLKEAKKLDKKRAERVKERLKDKSDKKLKSETNKNLEEQNVVIKEYNSNKKHRFKNLENTESFNDENNIRVSEDSEKSIKVPEVTEEEKKEFDENIDNAEHIKENYVFPPIELLNTLEQSETTSNKEIIRNGEIIEETMDVFGIDSKIIAINKGPVITCYELEPAPGVKLSKIVALNDNLSMALASPEIRIEAPIPGKAAVGIEVPNKIKDPVSVREMIESDEFKGKKTDIPLTLGKDVSGEIIIAEIDKMPHLLIAGATGSGKSVCINSIITSIIYKSSPDDVKLMLIDPKVVELSVYNGIPHLLIPVVTDPKKASLALSWAVGEMEKRYKAFAENSVRDLKSFNIKMEKQGNIDEKMPKIVIVVDELADLMMVCASEVEDYIARLAQMARAAGIYLIIATQRPSVDVITGTIKANIPSRIAFAVSSAIDSRTILDMAGAEKLLGKGDMLFYPGYNPKPIRVQGAFISDEEVENVVQFVKMNTHQVTEQELSEKIIKEIEEKKNNIANDLDPLFGDALNYIVEDEQASISFLQRKLKIGYSRAARIVDQMEELGVLGPHERSKPRKIIMSKEEIDKILEECNN